jgi:hypothetical protein
MIRIGSVGNSERSDVIFVLATRPHARSRLTCVYSLSPVIMLETLSCMSVWFVVYSIPRDTNETKNV